MKRKDLTNLVLLGDPGSGKSIISQYLLLNYNGLFSCKNNENKKPIEKAMVFFISIREFNSEINKKTKITVKDFISYQINEVLQKTAPIGFVEYWLNSGNALTIFDGLDEVILLEDRLKIRKLVTAFSSDFPNSRCLATSRVVGYTDAMLDKNIFLHFLIRGYDNEQKIEFVNKWYSEREDNLQFRKASIRGLLEALKEPHVAELAENPLMLTIMALVHKAEYDLPKQRSLLYDKCVEAFIINRNKAKDLLFYDENDMKAFHEFLGYTMQERDANLAKVQIPLSSSSINTSIRTSSKGPMEVSTSELEDLLLVYLKGGEELRPEDEVIFKDQIKAFLDSASRRVGLLVERGEAVWGFGHRSFQEYFAARYISQNTNGSIELWREVEKKIEITSWIEPLKLLAGIYGFTNRKALVDFVRKIMEEHRKKDSMDNKRLILAGEIVGEVTLNDKILIRQIAGEILENFMGTSDLSAFSNLKRVINNFYQIEEVWTLFVTVLQQRIRLLEQDSTKYLQTMFYGFYVNNKYGDTWIDKEIQKMNIQSY